MKKHNIHRILAFLFALVVLFPLTVQAVHTLENHEHTICTAKDVKHIHQQDLNCSICDAQIHPIVFDFPEEYTTLDLKITQHILVPYEQKEYSLGLYSKSSRAPPITVC